MAASASEVQKSLQTLLPKNIEETRVVPVMEHRGAEGQEWIYDPEWGTYRDVWVPVKSFTGEYFSPSLNRNLTPEGTRFVRPIKGQVADLSGDGGGYRTEDVGEFFVGEKLSKFLNDIGAPAEYIYGQQLPSGGFTFNPMNALPTDVGGRTNFAVNYGTSGEPSIQTYQSGTLFGSESIDKVIDRLAKAANAALLTYVGGQALGAIGGDLLGAAAGDPTKAALYGNAGYGEGLLNMVPPPVITEPVLVPGDNVLSSTLAQSPLAVENIAGQLTPEAQALLGGVGVAGGTAASDLAAIEASMGTPELLGSSNILDAINQAGVYGPDVLSGISPDVAAANLGAIEAAMGPATGPFLPSLNLEPVLVPGDNLLSSTLAQPPLFVEDIAGRLTPEATALMGSPTGPMLPQLPSVPTISGGQVTGPSLVDYNEAVGKSLAEAQQGFLESGKTLQDFLTPDTFVGPTMGDPTKAALYSNEGYGPISDQTVTGAPITASPITSLGPAATLKDITDYLTGGAFAGSVTDAFKEAFKAATGGGQQQQGGGGLGGLGPIIGGLLSRAPTAAPSATVTPGRAVDIVSPIQSLLAPKLVQQRPVTLL